jgi:cytochrome c553
MRGLKLLGKGLGVLVVLALVAGLGVYFYSESLMRAGPTPAFTALPKGDAVAGERIAEIVGCSGCHRDDLGGKPFVSIPNVVAMVAPDLTRARLRYDDAGLLRVLRSGVKADGRYALGMPGYMQQRLSDSEAADVIAFVRSLPPANSPEQKLTRVLPLGRLGLVLGKYHAYEGDTPESAGVLADRAEKKLGRHLAQIACTECHGKYFEGGPHVNAPALAIAKAYTPAQFDRLMRTGITLAGTESKTGLMSEVARGRFSQLTPEEMQALYAWLTGPDGLR